jgi:1-acyl-sn-glycerol-3-phosphate acyltransferase
VLKPLKDPKGLWPNLVQLSKGVPASTYLFATLLAGNAGQMASLAVRPFSHRAFRRINRELADLWWGHCVTLSRRLNGVHLVLSGDDIPAGENAIVVVNHQDMADITFLMMFARSRGRLGDMKWFVKEPLKYVPGVGWGMVFLDCLFVKRNWVDDEAIVAQTFAKFLNERIPLWLMIFAEGTRITPSKLQRSKEFARQRGLSPTEHVLLPRTKGFVASVQGLREHLDAVYDITIGYEEGVPTLWQYIKGLSKVAHLHLHRASIETLPKTDDDLARWLQDRYQVKDRLLGHFYRQGSFPRQV